MSRATPISPPVNARRTVTLNRRRRHIRAYCRALARAFRPQKIILFGSYAHGEPGPDSDVDLLVVMPFQGRAVDQVVAMRERVASPFALDLLVKTPAEIAARLAIGCPFTAELLSRGRVMYEAADA